MDSGFLFLVIVLTVTISTIIDFVSAIWADSESDDRAASVSATIAMLVKLTAILFVVIPILSSASEK